MKKVKTIPPGIARKLLFNFLRHDLAEEVEGDLHEKFYENLKHESIFKSKLKYWFQVLHYLRPFAIKKWKSSQTFYVMMYKNYFKTTLRNALRHKSYSFLNISGLAIGMMVAILIALWIWDEVSFDQYGQENYSTIAQVIQNVTNNGQVDTWTSVPYPLADAIRKSYPDDFDYVVLGTGGNSLLLSVDDKKLNKVGKFIEPDAPHLFSLTMIEGTRDGLKDPYSILLSRSAAIACFGTTEVINKVVHIDGRVDVKVTGVFEDFKSNSTFREMDFMAPWDLMVAETQWVKNMEDPWRPNAFDLYVKIKEGGSFELLSSKIKDEKLKHINSELAKKKPELFLFPMSRWHLFSEYKDGQNTGGLIQYVWLFGVIGVFVVILACINFMNLCTARAERRAKEIGVRKSIGSKRAQLIQQFFVESFVLVFLSIAIALLLSQLAMPYFNIIANKNISIPWTTPYFWGTCIGFILITGLIAGSYPAIYLSRFNAVQVLKGTFRAGKSATTLRRVLVVIQFTVSVIMIIGTAIVFQQIQFAKDRPIGYSSEALISIPVYSNEINKHFDVIKSSFSESGLITSVARASAGPTDSYSSTSGFTWPGKDPNLSVDFPFCQLSYEYGKTIGWEITDGRDFSRDFASDSSAIILNESAVKFMGLTDPVGTPMQWFGSECHVVGVVKDIIMQSPYEPVKPTVFTLDESGGNVVLVRAKAEASMPQVIQTLESTFKKQVPEQNFDYSFIDDDYALKFNREERIGKLASVFAALAIFISCLGIFGLASFVAEQRTKEVGIRKVLGASLFSVWKLLSTEFVALVVISSLLAMPIGYILLQSWLKGYTYHTNISWWIFALAFFSALIITLLTVSTQAIKAAFTNPVKSLRSE